MYFVPSLATSGITFYTGDRFPQWKGNAFIGAMVEGRTSGTGHVRRITFNEKGDSIQREPILAELHQRIRDVRQGPDGLLYVLTDEEPGARAAGGARAVVDVVSGFSRTEKTEGPPMGWPFVCTNLADHEPRRRAPAGGRL